jgi:hypothetical protein
MQGAAKCMHGFSVGHDHAMCNIQNHTIPVAQLIRHQNVSIINSKATGVLSSLQQCELLQYE